VANTFLPRHVIEFAPLVSFCSIVVSFTATLPLERKNRFREGGICFFVRAEMASLVSSPVSIIHRFIDLFEFKIDAALAGICFSTRMKQKSNSVLGRELVTRIRTSSSVG